jgi:hypothetical protein
MTARSPRFVLSVTNPDSTIWLEVLANEQRFFLFDDDNSVIQL